jgi:hypothetical protein
MSSIDVRLVPTLESLLQSNAPRLESSNPIKPASKQELNPLELLRQKALTEMKSSVGLVIISNQANSYTLTQLSSSEKSLNDFKNIVNNHEANFNYLAEAVAKLLEFSKSYTNFQKQFRKDNLFSGSETDKQNLWDIPSPRKLSFEDNPQYASQLNSIKDLHRNICEQHSVTITSKFSYALDRVFEALTQEKIKEISAEYEARVEGFTEAEIRVALMRDYLETKTNSPSELETFNRLLEKEIRNIHLDDQYHALTKRVKVLEYKQSILDAYKTESSPENSFTETLSPEALRKFQKDLEQYIRDNPGASSRDYSKALNILNTAPINSFTQTLEESIKHELHLTRLGRLSAVITSYQDLRPRGFVQGLYFPERVDHEDTPFLNIKTFDPERFYFPDGINPADEYLRVYEESLNGKMGDYRDQACKRDPRYADIEIFEQKRREACPEAKFCANGFINEARAILASNKLLPANSTQEYSVVKILDASYSGILDASQIDTILLIRHNDEYRAIFLQFKSSEKDATKYSMADSTISAIVPTNKSLDEIAQNINQVIQDNLVKQFGIKLSQSQVQAIEKLPTTLDVFSELELIKILTDSSFNTVAGSNSQDLCQKLSEYKVNGLQSGLNILMKPPENDTERESLLSTFLAREQIPLPQNQSPGLFFQALAVEIKEANLSVSFIRLATYRVAKAVKSNPNLTDQDLRDLIKASVSSAKEESILLEENTKAYINAINETLKKPYISEFKSAVNNYLKENDQLLPRTEGKLSKAKLKQLQRLMGKPEFLNQISSLLARQDISYNQFQEILPKLIHRTFTKDLGNGHVNDDTLEKILLQQYLTQELRGAVKEIVFKDTCTGAVNNLLRKRLTNSGDTMSVSILPNEQINSALIGFYNQDKSVLHQIIKAFKPEQQKEFQARLGNLLMENLKQDIYDQLLTEFDKSLASESRAQTKKTCRALKQDHSLSLRQQSEENLDQNYKNLAIVVLDFFGNSFGEDMRNFYYPNYDKEDDSGVRNYNKIDDSRMKNYNKIDRLLLSHSRIQSSPQELTKRLNRDLNTWTLKIDQERLEDLVKESINEIVGEMFGVNNNG